MLDSKAYDIVTQTERLMLSELRYRFDQAVELQAEKASLIAENERLRGGLVRIADNPFYELDSSELCRAIVCRAIARSTLRAPIQDSRREGTPE